MPVTFPVVARGVGRKDYSMATEKAVEPVITSWQSVYMFRKAIVIPALSNVVTDIEVPLKQVVLLYDFFASIPANRLIRLKVDAIYAGETLHVIDETAYQTVKSHISKGYPFFGTIRFITYNYWDSDEDYMRIGCSGLYTSLDEYFIKLGAAPPLP